MARKVNTASRGAVLQHIERPALARPVKEGKMFIILIAAAALGGIAYLGAKISDRKQHPISERLAVWGKRGTASFWEEVPPRGRKPG
jgi:hypothetical protein